MMTPVQLFEKWKKNIQPRWKVAFLAAFIIGLLIHLPVMLSDIPNHDGLASMYFDQNMVTSGRWFLTVACGISSYYTIPWLIGLLGMLYLSCAAVALIELLEIDDTIVIIVLSGLLVAFPALTSTFAYVFTMDGYMMALLLAVLSVLLTKKYRLGFIAGAVCLALSMGIYQAYLPFAMILCIYSIVVLFMEKEDWKERIKGCLRYLYMGISGVALYFVMLFLLLKIQGKELASYQGISGMGEAGTATVGLFDKLASIYKDFLAFSFKGNALFGNVYSVVAILVLVVLLLSVLLALTVKRKWWKKPMFFVIIGLLIVGLPVATNAVLIISPDVTYHLLMRYQWVLYPILFVAFINKYGKCCKFHAWLEWGVICAGCLLLFHYAVTDNIAYSNLEKKYEKTYAYCARLLDRIEQTEGYYQGIPIAMIGVVGEEQYPATDLTQEVTSNMIGMNGDYLLYTGANYQAFIKHYLGATLNILPAEAMAEMYYSEEYIAMETFPGADSIRIIDGVMYVKTENTAR